MNPKIKTTLKIDKPKNENPKNEDGPKRKTASLFVGDVQGDHIQPWLM